MRGAGIDDAAAYSHEAYKFMRDKIVRMSTANHYFAAVNFKNTEKKDYCYSVQFKITEKELGEKKQCKVGFLTAKKKSGECSSYASSDKTFGQPTEPNENTMLPLQTVPKALVLKNSTTRVKTAIKIRSL